MRLCLCAAEAKNRAAGPLRTAAARYARRRGRSGTMRAEEPVSRIMTEAVVVIEADRPVSEALECFMQYGFHHLPVVRRGRLVGMLSSADVLKLESFLPRNTADRTRLLDDR